jgi:hypothetical protein
MSAAIRTAGAARNPQPRQIASILDGRLSPATAATPTEDGRALFERLQTWREGSLPLFGYIHDPVTS